MFDAYEDEWIYHIAIFEKSIQFEIVFWLSCGCTFPSNLKQKPLICYLADAMEKFSHQKVNLCVLNQPKTINWHDFSFFFLSSLVAFSRLFIWMQILNIHCITSNFKIYQCIWFSIKDTVSTFNARKAQMH